MAGTPARRPTGGLSNFQIEVALMFFGLEASDGFLLAGGGALIALELIERTTFDLDFFTRQGATGVAAARDAIEHASALRNWPTTRVRDSATFCRLAICGPEDLMVDLCLDSPPLSPPSVSFLGPTFSPLELAGRKLLALFDRAEPRDFVDVYFLVQRFGKASLLTEASVIDHGFHPRYLAERMATLASLDRDELPIGDDQLEEMRHFFTHWVAELRQ